MRYLILTLLLLSSQIIFAQSTDEMRDVSPITDVRIDASEGVDYLPIVYDEGLTAVADTIAQRILDDEDIDSDRITELLTEAGYRINDYGGTWGTTFDTFDQLTANIADRYRDMILTETITHFALGFAEGRDINAYVFIAVAFNTCEALEDDQDLELQIDQGEKLLEILNEARAEDDLAPLTLDIDLLYNAARWYSDDMLEYGYPTKRVGGIPHIGADGSTTSERVDREGYETMVVRENILSRWTLSTEGAFDQWWNSPSHKENMMADDVSVMALAWTCDVTSGEFYYTQVLAEPFIAQSPDMVATGVTANLNAERVTAGVPILQPNPTLSTFADGIAEYIFVNNQFPNGMWDDLEAVYAYRTVYATSAGTSGDPVATTDYLLETYADDLLSRDFTEIGVGVYFDDIENYYWHVVILATPQ